MAHQFQSGHRLKQIKPLYILVLFFFLEKFFTGSNLY